MKEYKRRHRVLISLMIAAACTAAVIAAAACGKQEGPKTEGQQGTGETEWAVYWFLCGSNLESGSQSATLDLNEMLSVTLPEDVKVVIEAGGSGKWHTKGIDPEKITRLVYDRNGLKTVGYLPQANMGDAGTFSEFLRWCLKEHPSRHSMIILWDHGGGSLYGVSYDQNYNMDCLTYTELKDAFASAGGSNFDIIGFDACLMSSVDTIAACMNAADYMIASQQLEPVCGWDYASIMNALVRAPGLSAEDLGKAVCDGYFASCEKENLSDSATLCLCDLRKAEPLLQAYREKLLESFDNVLVSDEAAAELRRSAVEAENYGANGKSVGYTDMVDLLGCMGSSGKSFDYRLSELIGDTVVYQVRGSAYSRGCGISCYYPLDSSLRSVLQYAAATAPDADVSLFYRYMLNPAFDDTITGYAERRSISENEILKNRFRTSTLSLAGSPLVKGTDGKLTLELPESFSSDLSEVVLKITGVFEVENTVFYGTDKMYFSMEQGIYPAESYDFEKGIFVFSGAGKQVTMDGVQFATYVVSDTPSYTLLYSPAVIEDRDGILFFSVSKPENSVKFLGAYTGKIHTTGRYTMADVFSDTEDTTDALLYDEEASEEKEAFDYEFTFDELYDYHEEFGYIGEPREMEQYFRGKGKKTGSDESNESGKDMAAFAFERISQLKEGQHVTPVFSCVYTKTLEESADKNAFFANWETTESISYRKDIGISYEEGRYSEKYEKRNLYSYMLSDAWGNTAESDPVVLP